MPSGVGGGEESWEEGERVWKKEGGREEELTHESLPSRFRCL